VTFTNKYTPKEEPPAPAPKTGDDTNTTVPLLAMLASLTLMAFLGVRRKAAK
jgi:LPXTG-motif cell wall-anchored protein